MPYRRKQKKKRFTRRKRPYRRKRSLPVGGFANSKLVKLRYVQTISLNATGVIPAINEFRANSVYDPDKTGVGHQPSNHDRLAAIYDRYTVLGAKCTVHWVPTSSTPISPPPVLLLHTSENGGDLALAHASGGINNVLEQPRLSNSHSYIGDPSSKPVMLTKYFSAKKFFGISKFVGDSPYSADTTANPTEGAFFEVGVISPDDSVDPGAVSVRVEIDYIVVYTEPKRADAS